MIGDGTATGGRAVTGFATARRIRFAVTLAWQASRSLVSLTIALAVVRGVLPVAAALAVRGLVDALTQDRASQGWALVTALAGFGYVLIPLPDQYAQSELRRRLDVLLQARLFSAVNSVTGLELFEQAAFHDTLQMAQRASISGPQQVVRQSLTILQEALTVIGFVITLFVLVPVLALLSVIATVPVLLNELRLTNARVGAVYAMTPRERRRLFFGRLLTDPRAAKEVRLFGLGDWLLSRMLIEVRAANRLDRSVDLQELRTQCVALVPASAVAATTVLVAVHRTSAGGLSVGGLSAILAAVSGLQVAMAGIARNTGLLQTLLVLLDQLRQVLELPSQASVAVSGLDVAPLRHRLQLEDVWFRYGPDQPWVLQGVSLVLAPEQFVALIGVNGAGKSTLVKVMTGLYQPTHGQVLWDGQDIRTLEPSAFRLRLGVVFQDFMTYDLSAEENIGTGDLTALGDPDRLWAAAEFAGVGEVIRAMPSGMTTMLSQTFTGTESAADDAVVEAVSLSGGQAQRFAIARTALRDDADVLILDEPSSGLDADSEHDLTQRLLALRRRRCTVLITHRLGIARSADVILVLENGAIVESGTHVQLMRNSATYARLFKLQASGYQPAAEQAGAPQADPS